MNTPVITMVKTATCKSLSGRSEITYNLGKGADGEIFMRLEKNTGSGIFSDQWVSFGEIEGLMRQGPLDAPVGVRNLRPLYVGRSANSAGFLLAALINEGVTAKKEGSKFDYAWVSSAAYLETIRKGTLPETETEQPSKATAKKALNHVANPRRGRRPGGGQAAAA